jgi:Flp pilus assembly protein TadG
MRSHWNPTREDRGAAAVEFALVLPILLLLLGGIIDFGFALNTQISLTHAAREGVRVEALGTGDAVAVALAAFTAPAATDADAEVTTACLPDSDESARVVVSANSRIFFVGLLPFVDNELPLEGQAVMRCGG